MNPICIFEYLVDLVNWVAFWKINILRDGGFDNPAYNLTNMFLLNILFETFQVALTGSVYSVVIVATERYFNICKPFHKNLVIYFTTIDNTFYGFSDYFSLRKEPKKSILAFRVTSWTSHYHFDSLKVSLIMFTWPCWTTPWVGWWPIRFYWQPRGQIPFSLFWFDV